MSIRTRGLILSAIGALMVVAALAADPLGIGGFPGFGWKQIAGVVVGVIVTGAGIRDLRRPD